MSELNYLQFQPIDASSDDIFSNQIDDEKISLDDQIDEDSLNSFWDEVSEDLHRDPNWYTFADD